MTTSERWTERIDTACAEPDMASSNRSITRLHYALSEALADKLGRDAGPNFHTWAVWGSRKAGVTIRQEDLESALRNATITAGIAGALIGAATGVISGRALRWRPDTATAALGATLGALTGAWTGRQLAIWSRAQAAHLILDGNQTVLQDIGQQSARFLDMLENGATALARQNFFAGLRQGPTERNGQDRLAAAFRLYLEALDASDLGQKHAAMIAGNQEIVYHEHIRLDPYIRQSMPLIIRRCATKRLMMYEIGGRVLAVSKDLAGTHKPTAATNWTNIQERMRYVFALFEQFHDDPQVFSAPFAER